MFKQKISISMALLLVLTSNIYAEGENEPGYNQQPEYEHYYHEEEGTTPTETTDITQTIIQNLSTIKQKKEGKKGQNSSKVNFSSLIIMDSERSSIDTYGTSYTSSAFKLSYDQELNSDSDVGAIFLYRDTEDTSKNIQLVPYYKYYKTINNNIDLETIANLTLGQQNIDNGPDYNEYGGGLTVVPSYYINDALMFTLPVGIQTLKRGSESNNDDLQKIANYGIGGEYKPKPNISINANIMQTKDLDSDSNLKATYYVLQSTYYGEFWNVGLGYKTVKDVDNYDEDTYMLTVQYNW